MLHAGQTFDRYEIDAVLGSGGMATVYRARHTQLGSVHALKVLSAGTKSVRDRLLQEGRVQASLRHPNLVVVTDVLDVGGQPALVMEYVDGPSLEAFLAREVQMELAEAVALFRGVVRGTRYAHRKGLIHRDLKPGNILLADTPEGLVAKIVDFGLVKTLVTDENQLHQKAAKKDGPITQMGVAMGTPEYMAPEQIRDAASVDQRADLFSLGCIFYTLVCGVPPFTGRDMLEVFNKVTAGDYLPAERLVPTVPRGISEVIDGLLMVDPAGRIQSCDELLTMLDRPDLLDASGSAPLHPAQALRRARGGSSVTDDPTGPIARGYGTLSRPSDGGWARFPTNERAEAVRRDGWVNRALLGLFPLVTVPLGALAIAVVAVVSQGPAADAPKRAGAGAHLSTVLGGGVSVENDGNPQITVEDAQRAKAEPEPEPEPVVAPIPTVRRTAPRAVPRPAPGVIGKRASKDQMVKVSFTGKVRHVWLVRGKKRYSAAGSVPSGRYDVLALFHGAKKPVQAGKVSIDGPDPVVLRCNEVTLKCRY